MKQRDTKIRIPRIMGLTAMMVQFHKTEDESEKIKLKETITSHVIQQWLLSNGQFCGIYLNVYDLAKFLGCNPERIQLHMRDQLLNSKIWDRGKQEEMLTGLLGIQLSWTLEDRQEIDSQLNLLKRSQGDHYSPFISSEVNKALKLRMDSTVSLQTLVRGLSGGGNINIFNQFNQQNNQVNNTISQERALEIIEQEGKHIALPQEGAVKYLEENYCIEELPEVVASKQIGVNTDKEGLNLLKKDLKQITDNYKANLTDEAEEDFHEIRREIEEGIDMDSDDPEYLD